MSSCLAAPGDSTDREQRVFMEVQRRHLPESTRAPGNFASSLVLSQKVETCRKRLILGMLEAIER